MSQLIQTRPYITAMARQTPTRGQDPSRRHFWMAALIMYIVEGTGELLLLRQNGLGFWSETVVLYRWNPFTNRTMISTAWLVVLCWEAKGIWRQLIWPGEPVTEQLNIAVRSVTPYRVQFFYHVCKR